MVTSATVRELMAIAACRTTGSPTPLAVYRWQPEGYLLVRSAAAPFAAIELSVARLFGDED